jgi:hypothetical protein
MAYKKSLRNFASLLVAGMMAVAGWRSRRRLLRNRRGRALGNGQYGWRSHRRRAADGVQEGANRDARVSSDGSGRFVFERLESGKFKVVIEAPGFVSVTPVVELYWDIDVDFALRRPDETR